MAQTGIMSIQGDGFCETDVVGESHYQDNIERICGPRKPNGEEKRVKATLVLEKDNPHDKAAIRVDINNLTVGYLAHADAVDMRRQIKQRTPPGAVIEAVICNAEIVGGWDRGNGERGFYGVKLDLGEESDDDENDDEQPKTTIAQVSQQQMQAMYRDYKLPASEPIVVPQKRSLLDRLLGR